jgi:hypothetical protein
MTTLKLISKEVEDFINTLDVTPISRIEVKRDIPNDLDPKLNLASEIKIVFMDGTYWKYSRSKVNEDFKFSMK